MDTDKKKSFFDKLDVSGSYKELLLSEKNTGGKKVFGCTCPLVPPEIASAFDILLLKIPGFILESPAMIEQMNGVYDAIVLPACDGICAINPFPSVKEFRFAFPAGWGGDASVSIHNSYMAMLNELAGIDIKSINIEEFKRNTGIYESLRRTIRGICSAKNEKYGVISNGELSVIFETALTLPPQYALELLTPVLEWMRGEKGNPTPEVNAMIYGGRKFPFEVADKAESLGINPVEDDSCLGRRCFDISLNAQSNYLFYELLDAYSYRPLTPCLRTVEERYELLYKLLRNHGIETVIFFDDGECSFQSGHTNFLRIRMMRDGIDPLEVSSTDCAEKIGIYLDNY